MNKLLSIYRREVRAYFTTPFGYVITAVFMFITGFFFFSITNQLRQASLRFMFGNMSVILLLVTPILTMRLMAEERRLGTEELLMTSPLSSWQIIGGKFFAALTFFWAMSLCTLVYAFFIFRYGDPEVGPVVSGYVGLLAMNAAYVALGLFASTLTKSQMTASMVGFGLLLFLWVVDWLGQITNPPLKDMFESLSLFFHFDSFQKGVISLTHLFYFLALSFAFVFFSTRVLEGRRW